MEGGGGKNFFPKTLFLAILMYLLILAVFRNKEQKKIL